MGGLLGLTGLGFQGLGFWGLGVYRVSGLSGFRVSGPV